MDTESLLHSLNAHKVRYVVIGATAFLASDITETDPPLKYSVSRGLLKKVQMQGGMPQPGYPVRWVQAYWRYAAAMHPSARRADGYPGRPTWQRGLFQQPVRSAHASE
jgi:hypothetical protein